jgi:hypothetical protein
MMMAANLVGFVVGLDGVSYLAGQLLGSWAGEWYLPLFRPFHMCSNRNPVLDRRVHLLMDWCTVHVGISVRLHREHVSVRFELISDCALREEEMRRGIYRRC